MPPIATRISSHCRVVNRSTVFLLPLKEYFPINPLSLNNRVANSKQHASTPLIFSPRVVDSDAINLRGRSNFDTFDGVPAPRQVVCLDLEHIAVAGNHLIQHGIDEEPDEEPGDEAGHDDDGERLLRIRSDASGKSSW